MTLTLLLKNIAPPKKNYTKAIAYAKRLHNNNRLIKSLNKLGELNLELNNLEKALSGFLEALHVAKTSNAYALEAKVRANLANTHLQLDEIKKASKSINLAINQFETLKIKDDLDKAYIIAANIYKALNQDKKSYNHFKKAYLIAEKSNNINTLKLTSQGLAKAYEERGDLVNAINYHKKFNSYSTKIRDQEDIKNIIRLEIQDVYEQKSLTDSINKVNEFKLLQFEYDKKEERNKLRNYIALSSIIILLVIVLCIAYFYYQKKRIAIVLSNKNLIIKEALSDKEILLKEVHHRVKNNMQVVSSMLYLKSKNTENTIVKESLLDSKTRIDAMQLIHQKMYQKGNYQQIDAIEYFNDIVQLLLDPIKSQNDHFIIHGSELWLNVEQAQSLGFILHELIANSIKHAWHKTSTKKVEISISRSEDKIKFYYQDNGKGLPNTIDIKTTKSFGLKLIYSLSVRQLLGTIKINNINGFAINITFNAR
ncbi:MULTISPECIES: sensor histidine kinase [Winogradskyella]|uniref:sensor histidine kinase n=1 Tax=Winogradskyella TaxID=286104 RepID=UPI0015C86DF6|nr:MULTISPECIES: sensor histidine kinase [Winogradskyella]QXP80066.1 sensor histidine kinase [Winogradskyella sp. HaHa_3_26]